MADNAEQAAIELGLRLSKAFLDGMERNNSIPAGFWDDPFVLGFFGGCAIIGAPSTGLSNKGPGSVTVSGDALMRVLVGVLSALSGREAEELGQQVRRYHRKNPDFDRGVENANKLLSVTWGRPGYEDDPEVLAAQRRARDMTDSGAFGDHEITDRKAFLSALQLSLFLDVLVERFEPAAS